MCMRVSCESCGKCSWKGCGKHLADIYKSIEKGQHCMCKSWPGVVIPPQDEKTTRQPPSSSDASSSVATTTGIN